jgi:elongation factor P
MTGNTFDQRVSATEFVDEARLDMHECQVLYRDESGVHVMDTQSYEQYVLDSETVGDAAAWLEPEMRFYVELLDGRAIGVQLPAVGEYTIVETAPVMRTATKTASSKPAKLSNGVTVQVPEFLSEGDRIRVDPRSGMYLERAK